MATALWYNTPRKKSKKVLLGVKYESASETVQNETESLQDILNKYSKTGQIRRNQMVFFDEEDLSKINHYFAPHAIDLTDLDEMNEKISMLKQTINEAIEKRDAELDKNKQDIGEISEEDEGTDDPD